MNCNISSRLFKDYHAPLFSAREVAVDLKARGIVSRWYNGSSPVGTPRSSSPRLDSLAGRSKQISAPRHEKLQLCQQPFRKICPTVKMYMTSAGALHYNRPSRSPFPPNLSLEAVGWLG